MQEHYARPRKAKGQRAARKTKARKEEDGGEAEGRRETVHYVNEYIPYTNTLLQQRQYRKNKEKQETRKRKQEVPPEGRPSAAGPALRGTTSQWRDRPVAGIKADRGEETSRRRDETR